MSSTFTFVAGGPSIALQVGVEQMDFFRAEMRRDFHADRTEQRRRLGNRHAQLAMRNSVRIITTNPRVSLEYCRLVLQMCEGFFSLQEERTNEQARVMSYQIGELLMDAIRLFLLRAPVGYFEVYLKAFDFICSMEEDELLSGASPNDLLTVAMGRAREYLENVINPQ